MSENMNITNTFGMQNIPDQWGLIALTENPAINETHGVGGPEPILQQLEGLGSPGCENELQIIFDRSYAPPDISGPQTSPKVISNGDTHPGGMVFQRGVVGMHTTAFFMVPN